MSTHHHGQNICYFYSDSFKLHLDAQSHRPLRIHVQNYSTTYKLSLEYNAEGQIIYYKYLTQQFKEAKLLRIQARMQLDVQGQFGYYEDSYGNIWDKRWGASFPFEAILGRGEVYLKSILAPWGIGQSEYEALREWDVEHHNGKLLFYLWESYFPNV